MESMGRDMKVGEIYINEDKTIIAKFLGYTVYVCGQYEYYSTIGYIHKLDVISSSYENDISFKNFKGYDPFIIDDESKWTML